MPDSHETVDQLFQTAVKWFVICVKVVFVVATLIACYIVIMDWLYPGSFDQPLESLFWPDAAEQGKE